MYFHIPYPLWAFSSALTVFSWDIKEGLSLTDDTESALIRTCIGTVLLYLRDINSNNSYCEQPDVLTSYTSVYGPLDAL